MNLGITVGSTDESVGLFFNTLCRAKMCVGRDVGVLQGNEGKAEDGRLAAGVENHE